MSRHLNEVLELAKEDLSAANRMLSDVLIITGAQWKEFYANWSGWDSHYLETEDMELNAVFAIWGNNDCERLSDKIVIDDEAELNLGDLGYIVDTKKNGYHTRETRFTLLDHFAEKMQESLSYTREELADIAGCLSDRPDIARAEFLKSPGIGLMSCITELFMRKDLRSLDSLKVRKAYKDMTKHGYLLCSDEVNEFKAKAPGA